MNLKIAEMKRLIVAWVGAISLVQMALLDALILKLLH